MQNIIIHGATSFLGKHFVEKLISNGIPITIIARKTSDLSAFENNSLIKIIRYKKNLNELNIESFKTQLPVFFEFSWNGVFGSERNIPEQISINIPLTISSINLAHQLNAKHWIGVGSQAEYGNLDKRITELDECIPVTLYGKSKLLCSQISAELCKAYGIEHSWLRLFSVYGPNDNHEWLIQYLIKEMFNNKEINVTKGEQFWDYLFVDDISEMLFKLKDTSGVGVANLGSGKAVQVKYIIEKIKELTESDSTINFGTVPYREDQVMFMEADNSKLSNHLDWKAETNITEGLKKTIESIRPLIN